MGGEGYYRECLITAGDSLEIVRQKFQNAMTLASLYSDCALAKDLGFANSAASALIYFSMINQKFLDERVDYYLRYEHLQDDYSSLCRKLGVDCEVLPQHKKGFRKFDHHYSKYFSNWMREEIEYYFNDYIREFGYRFEQEGDL